MKLRVGWVSWISIAAVGLCASCAEPAGSGAGRASAVAAQEGVGIERADGRFTALVTAGTGLPASGLRTLAVAKSAKNSKPGISEIAVLAESTSFPPVRRVLGRFAVPDPAPGGRSLLLVAIEVDRAGVVKVGVRDGALSMPKNLLIDRLDGAAPMTIQVGPP